jgi:hypothetical protein
MSIKKTLDIEDENEWFMIKGAAGLRGKNIGEFIVYCVKKVIEEESE